MAEFFEKYFPQDVCRKKEIEFLKLNPGNMTIAKYVAMFDELVKFCLHYNGVAAEGLKCINSQSGLHPEIKQGIGYQEIHRFLMLVNKCRIYDEDNRARSTYYKSLRDKKVKN